MAASLDTAGTVLLWALEPLQLLGPAFGPQQPGGLKHQHSMALLDSGSQPAKPAPAMQPVQCTAICWLPLEETAQDALPVLACASRDGVVKLLATRTRCLSMPLLTLSIGPERTSARKPVQNLPSHCQTQIDQQWMPGRVLLR